MTRVPPIVREVTLPAGRSRTWPISVAPCADRMAAEEGEGALDAVRGDEGDEAALIGDVERVEAEELAGRAHILPDRNRGSRRSRWSSRPSRRSRPARWRDRRASGRAGNGRRIPPSIRARTGSTSGAQSLSMADSKPSPSRVAITAMPWRPMSPLTITASPGRTLCGSIGARARIRPTPAVLMNSPSALPRSTTLVSPVTMRTPAAGRCRAHRGDDAAERRDRAGLPRG